MFTHYFFTSHKRKTITGLVPIYVRITIGCQVFDRSTGITVIPETFNNQFKRVVNTTPGSDLINQKLNAVCVLLDELTTKPNITIIDIDKELRFLKKPSKYQKRHVAVTFLQAIDAYMKQQSLLIDKPNGIVLATYKTYEYRRKNFIDFLQHIKQPALLVQDFNKSIAAKFVRYSVEINFSINHRNKILKLARTVIDFSNDEFGTPLNDIKRLKLIKDIETITNYKYLTETELQLMYQTQFTSTMLQKATDLLIFYCTTGVNYCDSDLITLEALEFYKNVPFFKYKRKKSKVHGLLPALPMAVALLTKYGGKMPRLANSTVNRALKEVAQILGINKPVSTKYGRKTFATLMLNNGASLETTTKMLAKTNTKETEQVYGAIHQQRIINEMPNLRQYQLFA